MDKLPSNLMKKTIYFELTPSSRVYIAGGNNWECKSCYFNALATISSHKLGKGSWQKRSGRLPKVALTTFLLIQKKHVDLELTLSDRLNFEEVIKNEED